MTLTEFLLARIAEDEVMATEMLAAGVDEPGSLLQAHNDWITTEDQLAERWADEFSPARVVAESNSKRLVVDLCSILSGIPDHRGSDAKAILQWMTLPYAGHPDYCADWNLT